MLTGSDADLIKRVKNLPDHLISGTHYNAVDMVRRLKEYRKANNSTVAEYSVSDFFNQKGVQLFSTKYSNPIEKTLDAFKIYIERVSLNISFVAK